jgi:hypothetical protein
MAEDITQMWKNFSLAEDECLEWEAPAEEWRDVSSRGKNCVVGKLIADHQVSKETIKTTLLRWWRISKTLSFKVLGDNLFLVEFTNEGDKRRVLEGSPWGFESSLFLVEDFDGHTSPSELTFDHAAFWIRMVGLPLACMGRETGRMLGSSVGKVEAIDTDANGVGWGESLRVRVLIDLKKPLARGRMLKVQGKTKWIAFQYERLPKFCFNCGVIIHGKIGCQKKTMLRQKEVTEYGQWLKAPSPPRRHDRGSGRNGQRRETSYNYHEKREEAQPSTAASGGYAKMAAGGVDEPFPNPRRTKTQKERSGDLGENRGGVVEKFIAKMQKETDFQTEAHFGRYDSRSKDLNGGRESTYLSASKKARISPIKTGIRSDLEDIDGAVGEATWKNSGVSRGLFSSPTTRTEVVGFGGPVLTDVEKKIQGAKSASKRKSISAHSVGAEVEADGQKKSGEKLDEDRELVMQGRRKKREFGGDLKNKICDDNVGSGMAEAAEQPRRPQ